MGIGALRRYHPTLDEQLAEEANVSVGDRFNEQGNSSLDGVTTSAEVGHDASNESNVQHDPEGAHEPGSDEAEQREAEAEAERQAEADAQAKAAADEEERQKAATAEAEKLAAEQVEADKAAALEESTKHGELERPTRSASGDTWIAYAKADPEGEPFDLTPRSGLRDEIADHYLGSK